MTSAGEHYETRQGQPAAPGPRRNGFGIAALVLGLVGAALFWTVFGGIVLGLLALIFGVLGHRRSKRGLATNGIMSVVGAVIGTLALVVSSLLLALGVAVFKSDDFKSYQDCLQHADGKSDRQQCAKDFDRDISDR
ncbi:membrane-bound ClpP family serine protease [Streptomyces sp. B3I7]|uniref:DUF4190 domain-containing protein n=1 Tax=unclassified Streptomyces TaxID=2593676 RepID=UPI00277F1143|nr:MULTISPECIES: DUF4190 domain-containing protein [unclassified Streptomyces]MDQ0791110.1 membrane-bound ClpP family serine protease [Streptomyces sp. B3I8]MDQ0809170.1 membrane-bound ClpP family serine protease [Streptomyces sp. B3I7]